MRPREKWNTKHKNHINELNDLVLPPNARLKALSSYFKGGSALDLACGLGANSLFLAQLNYQVQAYDISDVAVDYVKEQAEKQQLPIDPQLSDLTTWGKRSIKKNAFDLVVITYYLDRMIFPLVQSSVKENGYFFMETFYQSQHNEHQSVSTKYKLRPKELRTIFEEWDIVYYEENEREGRQTILCRKGTII